MSKPNSLEKRFQEASKGGDDLGLFDAMKARREAYGGGFIGKLADLRSDEEELVSEIAELVREYALCCGLTPLDAFEVLIPLVRAELGKDSDNL